MDKLEFTKLLNTLLSQTTETEWLEFKKNNIDPEEIGEYISALSNSACLHDKVAAYLIFGIADKTHELVHLFEWDLIRKNLMIFQRKKEKFGISRIRFILKMKKHYRIVLMTKF